MKRVTIMLMIYIIFSMFFTEEASAGAGVARAGYVVLQLVTKSGATITFAVRNEVLSGVGIGYLGNELYNRIHSEEQNNKLHGFVLPTQPSQPLDIFPKSISVESTSDLSSVLSKYLTDKDSNPSITKIGNMSCLNLQTERGKLQCYEQTRIGLELLGARH